MRVFQASIEQMLWPERRRKDDLFTRLNIDGPASAGSSARPAESYIKLPAGYVPTSSAACSASASGSSPCSSENGDVEIGPIPKDTPVSLLTSIDVLGVDLPEAERKPRVKSS